MKAENIKIKSNSKTVIVKDTKIKLTEVPLTAKQIF